MVTLRLTCVKCFVIHSAPMKKTTREQAASAGQNKFYTGRPCRVGHLTERWVISGSCVECTRRHSRNGVAKKRKDLKNAARR
jgi:ribosomal protein L44E